MHGCVSVLHSSIALRIICSQMFLQVLGTQLSHKQKTLMLLHCCQEESPFLQLLQRRWKLQEPWTLVVATDYHTNATWSWYSPLGRYPTCCRSKTALGSQHLQQYCNYL